MSVVTNIVAAFAITTTRMVPCPCPDGIDGCCVLHMKEVVETRYEPIKVKESDEGGNAKGVSINIERVISAINFAYSYQVPPKLIPMKVHSYSDQGYPFNFGRHVVGFLMLDAVEHEIDALETLTDKEWGVTHK